MTWKSAVRHTVEVAARAKPIRSAVRRVADRLPERALRGVPIDEEFLVRVDRDHAFRYAADQRDVVGRQLFWHGLRRWERETWQVFVPLARNARGFLDIGAFTGAYTLVATSVNPTLRTTAFEPVPASFDRLLRNIEINGLQRRVTAMPAAVGSVSGVGRFFLPNRPLPDTGFLELSDRAPTEQGDWVEVPVTTVADAIPEGFPIDLVKIDVEDAEGPVVESMASILKQHRPTVVMEMLASGSFDQAVDVFAGLDYRFFHLTDRGAIQVERPRPVDGDHFMNFLLRPT